MRNFCMLAALSLTSTGCFTSHHGTDLSTLNQTPIVKGQTTEKELIARFGDPEATTMRGDGKRMLVWNDATGTVGFVTPAHVKSRNLSVTLENGVVVDFTDSAGGY
jgi:hypothetical protein